MEVVNHTTTEEDIQKVKDFLEKRLTLEGKPMQPVYKASFNKGKIEFLYSWITNQMYQHLMDNKTYQNALKTNPIEAQKFLNTQILQDCVLWPDTFDPTLRDELQPYPAGIIPGLIERIQIQSGFVENAAPDSVIIPPTVPEPPTEEEIKALLEKHPIGKKFNEAFGLPFFTRDYDYAEQQYILVPTRYYIFTALDGATYKKARDLGQGEEALAFVLESCVLWPEQVNWNDEPANYGQWLFNAVMTQSGFSVDPTLDGDEQV